VPSALVVGATGLVGRHIVALLAGDAHYDRVSTVARRTLPDPLPRVEQHILSFDELEAHASRLGADHVFCALGTTRKAAGSKERFRAVDVVYPTRIASLTRARGARYFSLISAVGASSRSLFFYNRMKAEAEAGVQGAGFPSGSILRPSILGGERDSRPVERLAQTAMRLAPRRWRTVDARDVAAAAIALARDEKPGWRVVESEEIRRLARRS
jgi:uncharacterized protein YbjT (DUF2867 family)